MPYTSTVLSPPKQKSASAFDLHAYSLSRTLPPSDLNGGVHSLAHIVPTNNTAAGYYAINVYPETEKLCSPKLSTQLPPLRNSHLNNYLFDSHHHQNDVRSHKLPALIPMRISSPVSTTGFDINSLQIRPISHQSVTPPKRSHNRPSASALSTVGSFSTSPSSSSFVVTPLLRAASIGSLSPLPPLMNGTSTYPASTSSGGSLSPFTASSKAMSKSPKNHSPILVHNSTAPLIRTSDSLSRSDLHPSAVTHKTKPTTKNASLSPSNGIGSLAELKELNKGIKKQKGTDIKESKRYQCKTCQKCFTTSGHLARHTRIHTGERKHVCPYPNCESRFARQDNCMQHYRTHLNNGKRKRKDRAAKEHDNDE